MTINFDNQTVDVPCGNCRKKLTETIRRLKTDPNLTCSSCGAVTHVDANEFRKVEQSVNKSLNDLRKAFGKLGK
ncbi:zinc finger, LSD1 subclass domain protein [Paraburkholderia xenovorans LB400]|uniref:hypothetical protein n=1 Tax=Paraburkholderia xenovorans TaxID=36873 RepID=UPI00003C4AC1|nr:hypothetical protein [Paraburkholderia xenovorans]AIP33274.1 zinc finger, LSD1 subclass domain protein [Paraburkholderia xenovorans LB400]